MNLNLRNLLFLLFICFYQYLPSHAQSLFGPYSLIAHRGGVTNGDHVENSLPALEEAIPQGLLDG